MMLPRKFLAFLLLIKMVSSQTIYPTTAVSYSTSSVPTIQTFPIAPTPNVSAAPTVISATMPTAIPATMTTTSPTSPIPATCVTASPMPLSSSTTSALSATCVTVSPMSLSQSPTSAIPATCVTASPMSLSSPTITSVPSSVPKVVGSPITSEISKPKAYFLPANIPDPKVTVFANDNPSLLEIKPRLYEESGYLDVKSTKCTDLPPKIRKGSGPLTPAKRLTMACTDDVPNILNDKPVCPGISKMDITPPPVLKKDKGSLNPIDFEGLFDSFMTCL